MGLGIAMGTGVLPIPGPISVAVGQNPRHRPPPQGSSGGKDLNLTILLKFNPAYSIYTKWSFRNKHSIHLRAHWLPLIMKTFAFHQ